MEQDSDDGPQIDAEGIMWALLGGFCLSVPGCMVGRIAGMGHGRGHREIAGMLAGFILGTILCYAVYSAFSGDNENDFDVDGSEE
jgi:hypothetical protein